MRQPEGTKIEIDESRFFVTTGGKSLSDSRPEEVILLDEGAFADNVDELVDEFELLDVNSRNLESVSKLANPISVALRYVENELNMTRHNAPPEGKFARGARELGDPEAAARHKAFESLSAIRERLVAAFKKLEIAVANTIHLRSVGSNSGYERATIAYSKLAKAKLDCDALIEQLRASGGRTVSKGFLGGGDALLASLKRFYTEYSGYTGGGKKLPIEKSKISVWIFSLASISANKESLLRDLGVFSEAIGGDMNKVGDLLNSRQSAVRKNLFQGEIQERELHTLIREPLDLDRLAIENRWQVFSASAGDTINLVVDTTNGVFAGVKAGAEGVVELGGTATQAAINGALHTGNALKSGFDAVTSGVSSTVSSVGGALRGLGKKKE
jgi:hypothetical protein